MTVHAPSDVRAVTVPEHFGGCGTAHQAGDLQPGERWALECQPCETALTSAPLNSHGWASQVDKVSLTPDERQLLTSQEKEGSAATAMMVRQLGDTLAQAMRQGYSGMAGLPAPTPQFLQPTSENITEALKSMAPNDLEQLLRRAGLAAPEASSDTSPEITPTPVSEPVAAKKATKAAAAKPAEG